MTGGSVLYTADDGAPGGLPFLVLHHRYGGLDDARALGAMLGDHVHRRAIRALRTQTDGGMGVPMGYYWYVGPVETPEPATLADGLSQLEAEFLQAAARHPSGKAGLFGRGEGGVMALLIALIWPEKCAALVLQDVPLPGNLDRLPLGPGRVDGLAVFILGDDCAGVAANLSARGAVVHRIDAPELANILPDILPAPGAQA